MVLLKKRRHYSILATFIIQILNVNSEMKHSVKPFVKIGISKITVENNTVSPVINQTELSKVSITGTTTVSTTSDPAEINRTTPSKIVQLNNSSTTTSTPTTASIDHQKVSEKSRTKSDENDYKEKNLRGYFCKCDLHPGSCDINCCCDVDCGKDILKVFHCEHEEHRNSVDSENNKPFFRPCGASADLFCIFKDNSKKNIREDYNPDFKKDSRKMITWPDPLESIEEIQYKIFYKINEPILFYDLRTDEIKTFDLPYSLGYSICQLYEPLNYLESFTRECFMSYGSGERFFKEFLNYNKWARILKIPKHVETEGNTIENHYKDEDNYIKIDLWDCLQEDNQELKLNSQNLNELCELRDLYNISTDFNLTETQEYDESDGERSLSPGEIPYKILIQITHNYTNLVSMKVFVIHHINGNPSIYDDKIAIRMEVNFEIFNATKKNFIEESTLSGPLGYIPNKPLIIGKLITLNEGKEDDSDSIEKSDEFIEKHGFADYFYPSNKRNLKEKSKEKITNRRIYLPSINRGQDCAYVDSETLNFKVNSLAQCNVRFENSTILNEKSNFTQICTKIQKDVFYYLFGLRKNMSLDLRTEFKLLRVSKFGKPKNRTDSWIKMQFQSSNMPDNKIIEGIYKRFRKIETFTCKNINIYGKYEFFVNREEIYGIKHQYVIQEANAALNTFVDLTFNLKDEIKIPIYQSVRFYDLTDYKTNIAALLQHNIITSILIVMISMII